MNLHIWDFFKSRFRGFGVLGFWAFTNKCPVTFGPTSCCTPFVPFSLGACGVIVRTLTFGGWSWSIFLPGSTNSLPNFCWIIWENNKVLMRYLKAGDWGKLSVIHTSIMFIINWLELRTFLEENFSKSFFLRKFSLGSRFSSQIFLRKPNKFP